MDGNETTTLDASMIKFFVRFYIKWLCKLTSDKSLCFLLAIVHLQRSEKDYKSRNSNFHLLPYKCDKRNIFFNESFWEEKENYTPQVFNGPKLYTVAASSMSGNRRWEKKNCMTREKRFGNAIRTRNAV